MKELELVKVLSDYSVILIIVAIAIYYLTKYVNLKLKHFELQLNESFKPHFFELTGEVETVNNENEFKKVINLKVEKKLKPR